VNGLHDVGTKIQERACQAYQPSEWTSEPPDPDRRYTRRLERGLIILAPCKGVDANIYTCELKCCSDVKELFLRAPLTESTGEERHSQRTRRNFCPFS
jgi:hypothetical protein